MTMTRVLIIEDNLDLANVVRSLLELEKHAVDVCHTGGAGLEKIMSSPYDLVILDWDLPDINGMEILRQFRARGARTPVIMLTGKNSVEEKEAGLDGGADDYLTKPFSMKELGARVRAHIRRSQTSAGNGDSLADISLDSYNSRATRGGRLYSLPAQEFALLDFAARHVHLKPSAADLLRFSWPKDVEASEENLQLAIRRLRKKFDPQGRIIFPHLYAENRPQSAADRLAGGLKAAASPDIDPFIGTIFNGKYELQELIGGGGSGLVYRGKHAVLGNAVALKVLHLNAITQSEAVRRFQREAKLTALLAHPNIVGIRDFGLSEQGAPYLVMDLVDGDSLGEMLGRGAKPTLPQIIRIFSQACQGLDHAHEKGLIHRDIKPSNLMLVKNGDAGDITVKIVDFGLARTEVADQGISKITQTGVVLGSPHYMSPEQCRGEAVDRRTDIYSLGCALFEALQGEPPFSGKSPVETLVKHVTSEVREMVLEGESPLVQIRLNRIVKRCLSKDREARYQTAGALAADLDSVLAD